MEARGSSAAKEGRAPSVPRPPQDPACPDSITSLEARRGSLDEDWLIRVYCPGSQRMYDVQAPEQPVQGISPSVSEKIRTISTLCKRKSSKDWLMQEPSTPLQPSSGAPNMGGSENQWLLKLKCPRSQTEYDLQTPEQRATSSLARSRSPSTFGRSASERKKACEDWLTQKHFSQVQEVDKYLRHRDFLELRKKEIQYKKWLERVSEPLLQKIEDKVDSQSSEEIEERKRKQLSLYLNYCNKKGKVALEDYDSSEYDPLFLNTHPTYLKVSTPPLHDPLLKEVQGRFLEGGLIQQCETGRIYSAKERNDLYKAKLPLLPLGRQNMDAADWLKIPPGYVESEIRQRKRRRVKRNHNAGNLDFKAWADSTCPPTLWKEEMYIY
ncbi:protein FAM228B isoform X2 [Malaclemys terrapin pileata]|uniref:protein FAM228B isoform X2 n=1 Tax=Malaclemys terrapin pileata TaxID=2991368 RepID=UPI0023A8D1F4|nr:protein FAM228B isoform X2 [Malaclemys terrapin pileata]